MPPAVLTPEQCAAIDTRSVSIALSAGAGCGKTHVLTQRFLSHLEPPADGEPPTALGRLIAITFTDAAARQMRARIRGACFDRLAAAQGGAQAHWLRLLREIDSARVSTIHAFCASLLRSHAAAAGLDPTFAVLDQGEADLLQYETVDDVLREQLRDLDADTLDLAAGYGLGRLKQQIATLLAACQNPAFDAWRDKSADDALDAWQAYHGDHALPLAESAIANDAPIDEILTMLREIDPQGKKPKFLDARATLLDLLPRVQAGTATTAELQSIRKSAQVSGLCTAKDWNPPDAYHGYRDACTALRGAIDRHAPQPFDREAARQPARLGLALLHLTAKVAGEYTARKQDRGALDFDDLLATSYRLISSAEHADLRNQFADNLCLLLVDEFQDTDQLQVDLVRALCGPGFDAGRLFFVGDFKQSIYRFRGAAPTVFRELRSQVDATGQLPLTVNFRSQPAILDFVNALFCDAFTSADQAYEPLRADRDQLTELPAVEFLWTLTPDKNNRRIAGSALDARRQEARAIACRLRAMIDGEHGERPIVGKDGKPRTLEPGDVAILFRALSDVQVYEEALRDYGLDYYLVGGHAFYAQQEIYDVLNLLRAVASTADEVSLAGALRSPFFALADETLFWLVDSAGSLNAGLLGDGFPSELSPEERSKAAAAAETIGLLRGVKDRLPIAQLLRLALERTGYDAVLLTEFLGQRKLANLHKLVERARVADAGAVDLDGFITQLSQFIARDPKEALAATLPEAANVIRLMTIHHAKGLEFPLVVVPDLDRRPLLVPPPAALDPRLGPLIPAPADDDGAKFTTGMSLFAAAERGEELEERKRMLYVAATRAADYLIFSSSLAAYDKPQSDWMKLLGERFDLKTGGLLARLDSGCATPSVRVTTEPKTSFKPGGKSRGPDLAKMLEAACRGAAEGDFAIPSEVAPIPIDRAARRAFSFSHLSGQLEPIAMDVEALSDEVRLDARGFGLLVHDVLAHIDFRGPDGELAQWCEHLAPLHVLVNAKEAAERAHGLIARFVASPAGRRLAEAPAVHREVEFLLAWPPGEQGDEAAHIRGYIDCLYQDSVGAWRLADYKTDHVTAAGIEQRARRYELQLYVYALAAERALGQPPVELSLHFLRAGAEQVFGWNESVRRRAIEMITASITTALRAPSGDEGLVASAAL